MLHRYRPIVGLTSTVLLLSMSCAARSYDFLLRRSAPPQIAAGNDTGQQARSGSASAWKLSRFKGRKDDENFVSIMKTAEALQSDPDFVGLMVRCDPKGKIDLLLVVVSPLPPNSRPQVTVRTSSTSFSFEATPAAGGAALNLPDEASSLAANDWQGAPSLSISVQDKDTEIKGLVDLKGFAGAYQNLRGNCPD